MTNKLIYSDIIFEGEENGVWVTFLEWENKIFFFTLKMVSGVFDIDTHLILSQKIWAVGPLLRILSTQRGGYYGYHFVII